MIELDKDGKLTAALHEHGNQVELLRHQTNLDLRILTGYFTIQLVFGSWISANPVEGLYARLGLGAIDLALCLLAGLILWRNYVRRSQVIEVVRRLNEALGYTEPGVYLADRRLHETTPFIPWLPYYVASIMVGAVGVAILLFQPVSA